MSIMSPEQLKKMLFYKFLSISNLDMLQAKTSRGKRGDQVLENYTFDMVNCVRVNCMINIEQGRYGVLKNEQEIR